MAFSKIITGDCLKVLPEFEDKYFEICMTSPPYNLGIKYKTYKDSKKRGDYLRWIKEIFLIIKSKTMDNGSLFLNVGNSNKDPWVTYDIAQVLRSDWVLQNDIIWAKSISIDDKTYGHFKPINSKRFVNHTYEHIFHFTKNGNVPINRLAIGVPYQDKSNIRRWKHNRDLRCRGNLWYIPYKTIRSTKEKGDHPAIFPQQLVEWCIKLHGYNANTIICDPFAGTGTTLLVAKHLGVNAIGIEIDKYYADYVKTKLDKEII